MRGPATSTEWSIEGRRLVSLMPRLVPQTVFTAKATLTANKTTIENSAILSRKGISCCWIFILHWSVYITA